jgi:CDP-diacylglycerol--inositol 3-phosphatidyltransferase
MGVTSTQVFLYVPNVIGYARVVLLIASLFFALGQPAVFLALYAASFLLDAADGHAARLLGQTSKFGAVLDMATDRVATNALVLTLSHLYRDYVVWFQLLCILDLGSHWLRMYSSLLEGAASHKSASAERDGHLVTLYYTNRLVLGGVCLLNEFFYIGLYSLYHAPGSPAVRYLVLFTAPVFAFKQYLSLMQLLNSCRAIVEHDVRDASK